ncbi:NAD(P)-dependent oxidoreductase [Curtobacterium sp. ISL-83]|uniref:NAD(P)-dependent oxidoreductase n=1 Tax=Curtobacterium sp. ISL-83 TaxID=2819145 RepID=UPI001BE9066B|nr:NAD(P)H-binding protein [Curtobacterium sp. ISL-83]MBT2503502.1 NAD(P)H-binding protein [Curtobacterium sp. ISL-83]
MNEQKTFLVFGGTGQTGRHFVRLALQQGHAVRVLARTPSKLAMEHEDLQVVPGSITSELDLDALLTGTDAVVAMLGDVAAQRERQVNTEFVRALVPAMRRQGVRRFLYQAGGLSAAPGKRLAPALRLVRSTIARGYIGQHEDNEAVMRYLDEEARDIEWMVHRAGIGSDGPSKGELYRSPSAISIGTFVDCAAYNLRTVQDERAVHTCDPSTYRRPSGDRDRA